jgi:hypothetical protein
MMVRGNPPLNLIISAAQQPVAPLHALSCLCLAMGITHRDVFFSGFIPR